MVQPGAGESGIGELVLKGDGVSVRDMKPLWRGMVVMVAQQCQCTECHCTLKMYHFNHFYIKKKKATLLFNGKPLLAPLLVLLKRQSGRVAAESGAQLHSTTQDPCS